MKSKIVALVAGVVALIGLTACNSLSWPSEDQQVQDFVRLLEQRGHKIDQVPNPKKGPNEPSHIANSGWETESKTVKKRKVNGKPVDIKKGTKIAEVVVVAQDNNDNGNCKFELELLLNQDPRDAFYADEGRDASGKETGLAENFNTDRPSPDALRQYAADHSKNNGPLAFCASQPYKPSEHQND